MTRPQQETEQQMPPWLYELYGIPRPDSEEDDHFASWELELLDPERN